MRPARHSPHSVNAARDPYGSDFRENTQAGSTESSDAAEVLLWFGALMMRAGNTAARTREWIEEMAPTMGFHSISLSLSTDNITASVRRSGQQITIMREIGVPGINASRIAELEQLARSIGSKSAPPDISAKLAEIESTGPRYSRMQIAAGVGVASGAFAFDQNGAAIPECLQLRWAAEWSMDAIVAVAPLSQSIRCRRVGRHCSDGCLRLGSGARVSRRVPICPLPSGLYRLGTFLDPRLPACRRVVRLAATANRRGGEPVRLRRHDAIGRRFGPEFCYCNCRN